MRVLVEENDIAVQEVPVNQRQEGYVPFLKYMLTESQKDPKLNGLYSEHDDVQYGLAGRNHLLQVLRALIMGWSGPSM